MPKLPESLFESKEPEHVKLAAPMGDCPLCRVVTDEIPVWENDKYAIYQTKEKKGHDIRVMILVKEHFYTLPSEEECTALGFLFAELLKDIIPRGSITGFTILSDWYSSLSKHWHRVACSGDDGCDSELMGKTPSIKCVVNRDFLPTA